MRKYSILWVGCRGLGANCSLSLESIPSVGLEENGSVGRYPHNVVFKLFLCIYEDDILCA